MAKFTPKNITLMKNGIIGICRIEFYLAGVGSLKEKRSIIKPLLNRLRAQFNVSCAEIDHNDVWQSAAIGIVTVSNSSRHVQEMLNNVVDWIEDSFPDAMITQQDIEIL